MYFHHYLLIFVVYFLSHVPSPSFAQPFKAVNLGNWLVIEGWMKPSLFQGIPYNDLLDETKVRFMSIKSRKYLTAENGGGSIVANRPSAADWENFRLWRINETYFNFRVFNKQFVGLQDQGNIVTAGSNTAGKPETFQIVRNSGYLDRVRLRASNGLFLQVQQESLVTADYAGTGWEDSNPSVCKMTKVGDQLQGEYQISNGYGPDRASQVLQDHRKDYITETDFGFMSANGLNAVRIPVGWWIAQNPPQKPFVSGSLEALDNAFTWAQNHGMKVIVDLHAVKASQNGNDHSGTRDGYQEWGESNIQETVNVIEFLAERYANRLSLAAIELMNEPTAPGVTLDALKKYYQAGYDAVRKHTQTAYVIFSNRLGPADSKELLLFASSLNRVVIDVHYYNLYSDIKNKNAQQNIDYIYNERAQALSAVTTTNGPLSFVGEWTGEWGVNQASMQDYQRFAKAQQQVYEKASFVSPRAYLILF